MRGKETLSDSQVTKRKYKHEVGRVENDFSETEKAKISSSNVTSIDTTRAADDARQKSDAHFEGLCGTT